MTSDEKAALEVIEAAREEDEFATITDFVRFGASCFHQAKLTFGQSTADGIGEAYALVLHALHLPPHPHIPSELHRARLTHAERETVLYLFSRRIKERIPSAYITEEAWFAGLRFEVDQRVIIPRSPLAEFIEARFYPWVDDAQVRRILDIGTGCGCIAIACAHEFPDAMVDAVDIDESALQVARDNIRLYGLEERVEVHQADLFPPAAPETPDGDARKRYDLIVSNPPYVPTEEMIRLEPEFRAEPEIALAGDADGLGVVGRLVDGARDWLTPNEGVLVIEIGASPVVRDAFEDRFRDMPFTRLEPERGGEGIYLITERGLHGR